MSPLILLITLINFLVLHENPFFCQERPGKNEKIFKMIKFKTMKCPRDNKGKKITDEQRLNLIKEFGENSVMSDAKRITKFGKILRKLSIDEIPELFNIFVGQMSFVGPRPLAVIYLPFYNKNERKRHSVLPGLTGLAQVNGRNIISWEKRFEYDIQYVNKCSLWLDIKIFFKTFAVVLKHKDVAQGEERPEPFNIVRQKQLLEKK